MAEPRSKRMQVVLLLAERTEQEAAQRLGQYRETFIAEQEQLRQIEEYAEQYLHSYTSRTNGLYAQELIAYSGFIQRLEDAKKDQRNKLEQMQKTLDRIRLDWREKYQRRNSIKDLIARLKTEENDVLEKRLQKELDELASQQFQRNS